MYKIDFDMFTSSRLELIFLQKLILKIESSNSIIDFYTQIYC